MNLNDEVRSHIEVANLQPPRVGQQVFKDDCAYCFDTPFSPSGLDVCLHCFSASSPDPDHDYTAYHSQLTGHYVFLNIKKTKKEKIRDEPAKKLVKLAIEADKEEDHFDTQTHVKDINFPDVAVDLSWDHLGAVVDGVMAATSYARKEEIQAWEHELKSCQHILSLDQKAVPDCYKAPPDHCHSCELTENLWICLQCGGLGCGRSQFGGTVGNGHGLGHYNESGHSVSVKLGSITPEGTADVFCYICEEEVVDPQLAAHLAHWNISIADRVQTEKSLTELNIEQNLKWDFSMTTGSGEVLRPLFAPGITGIRNLGNSCYMASVMQCLFALPQFQERFGGVYQSLAREPANDLEVQMRKFADGLLSGRYAVPDEDIKSEVRHQKGISPGMFKSLIGRNHAEFATMRQQDAFEFFIHLLDKLHEYAQKNGVEDITSIFQFDTEQRIQCDSCHQVRYRTEHQENISIPVPARKQEDGDEFETIRLKECLDLYTADNSVDFKCSNCGHKGSITSTKFKSYPDVLVLNARRFQIVNWVPTKHDIPVDVPDDVFALDEYISKGRQPGEEEMEDKEEQSDSFAPNENALAQLEGMGMPRNRAEKALYVTGNSDAESALNWLLEHMEDPDIDDPIVATSGPSVVSDEKVIMMVSMGIGEEQAKNALAKNNGDVETAISWIFENPGAADTDIEIADAADNENVARGDCSLPARYRLMSIICHKGGSIHAGHYVAFVRKRVEGAENWVLFNDEKAVLGGEAEEMKKHAYVYVFERIK